MSLYPDGNCGGNGGDQPVEIDLLRAISIVDQSIPTDIDGSVVQFEVTKESSYITISNGIVEFEHDGVYSLFIKLHLDVISGFTNSIESWFESSIDNGSTWQFVEDSGDIKEFDSLNEGTIIYKANASVTADTLFRLKIRATGGTPQLGSPTLTNGIKVPSTAISIGNL